MEVKEIVENEVCMLELAYGIEHIFKVTVEKESDEVIVKAITYDGYMYLDTLLVRLSEALSGATMIDDETIVVKATSTIKEK